MTNFERIKAMTIEELAKVIDINIEGVCKNFKYCRLTIGTKEEFTEDDCNACAVRWLMEEAIE